MNLWAADAAVGKEAAQEISATPNVKGLFILALFFSHLRSDVFTRRLKEFQPKREKSVTVHDAMSRATQALFTRMPTTIIANESACCRIVRSISLSTIRRIGPIHPEIGSLNS